MLCQVDSRFVASQSVAKITVMFTRSQTTLGLFRNCEGELGCSRGCDAAPSDCGQCCTITTPSTCGYLFANDSYSIFDIRWNRTMDSTIYLVTADLPSCVIKDKGPNGKLFKLHCSSAFSNLTESMIVCLFVVWFFILLGQPVNLANSFWVYPTQSEACMRDTTVCCVDHVDCASDHRFFIFFTTDGTMFAISIMHLVCKRLRMRLVWKQVYFWKLNRAILSYVMHSYAFQIDPLIAAQIKCDPAEWASEWEECCTKSVSIYLSIWRILCINIINYAGF
jgi:hypothetical protein